MLAALWFLLLVPGAGTLGVHWRLLQPATLVVAVLGLWCAAAGTGLMTWIYARHTGVYVLVVALLLALPAPVEWMRRAERPLMLFAAICAMAAISYNVDLFLFGRFVDRNLTPGVIDAAAAPAPWPSKRPEAHAARILFKFAAGEEYVRDVVMPTYDWFRVRSRLLQLLPLRPPKRAVPSFGGRRRLAALHLSLHCRGARPCPRRSGSDVPDFPFRALLRELTEPPTLSPGRNRSGNARCRAAGRAGFPLFRPGLSARRRDAARLAPYDRAQERSQEARRHYQRPELFGPLFFTSPTRPRLCASLPAVAILDRRHQTGLPDYGLFSCHPVVSARYAKLPRTCR